MRGGLLRYGDFVHVSAAMFRQGLVSRPQFATYLHDVGFDNGRFPGLEGAGYVQLVSQDQVGSFVSAARADGLADYSVTPAGARSTYCLGSYADTAGLASSVPLLGYDLCTVPGISAALYAARDTGQQSVVVGSTLGPQFRSDFVLIAPVYSGTPDTLIDRLQDIRGWSMAIVDSTAFDHADVDGQNGRIMVALFSGDSTSRSDLVFSEISRSKTARWLVTDHVVAYSDWTLEMAPQGIAFLVPHSGSQALLYVGIGASLLLAILIWLLAFGRVRALEMVRRRTRELEHLALYDALTDLPNRTLILDRAEQMLMRAGRQNSSVGALFLDIDNFKDVNEFFGHHVGDEVLRAVGVRLASTIRGVDTVGRLAGDEFVILLESDTIDVGPEVLAARVLSAFEDPFELDSEGSLEIDVRASIGVAQGRPDSAEELLLDADVALHEAKTKGKNRFVMFKAEMATAVHDRRLLEADLRHALARGELALVYQPTFTLEDMSVTGAEALLRWHHPVRGLVPPVAFIPIAEETGLIVEIGQFVLEQAFREAASWHRAGFPITISVNVSGRQLDHEDFVDHVRHALAVSGLSPAFAMLEITETMLMEDVCNTVERLTALKKLGLRIAVDDFGTGYSSLAYLRQFPVDRLKVDRAFVAQMSVSTESRALVHTLVQLGRTLGLQVLAEGIEEESQLVALRAEGCEKGQGFLYSRPLDPVSVREFLHRRYGKAQRAMVVAADPVPMLTSYRPS